MEIRNVISENTFVFATLFSRFFPCFYVHARDDAIGGTVEDTDRESQVK